MTEPWGKKKTKTEYRVGRVGMAALGIAVLLFVVSTSFFASSYGAANAPVRTTTIGVSTSTVTLNVTLTSTSTETNDIYYTTTATVLSTATYLGPDTIALSGKASANGGATAITFTNSESGVPFSGTMSSGSYQVSLPNRAFYVVTISHRGVIGTGLGAGTCTAGGLGVFVGGSSMTADWSC